MDNRIAMAHADLSARLAEIAADYPGFPKQTLILRDPAHPGRHMILSNEDDEVGNAIEVIVKVE